jgi:isopenicillin-N N-acyltransferase like protein
MKRLLKITGYCMAAMLLLLATTVAYIRWGMEPEKPKPADMGALQLQRQKAGENFYRIGNNWLRKSKTGLWEEYIEGDPFTRGVVAGKLTKELLYTQEVAFVDQIHQLVPSDFYLNFLGLFTRVFNRNLSANIPEEFKLEIYGESFSAPHQFDYIAPAYDRMLNYHSAHDIGHALQNFALVGCTSFSGWDSRTQDSSLIVGRNCDFYVGDKFAEDKIVYFCNPAGGHKFAMITWAGMMGCVSGMNDRGITVTINAAKSDMPTGSATPIALLAREILQYAGSIDEAYAIAKKRKTFVSESIMIGSAPDHKTAIIEKSPTKLGMYFSNRDYILCTNHYQSDTFKNEKNNLENIATTASMYRYRRLQQLTDSTPRFNYLNVAAILRDQKGLNGADIGIGNEKAVNQLICHHSIIFEPEKLRFWVSTSPYQLGEYVCYDLAKVFKDDIGLTTNREIIDSNLTIPADTFLQSDRWKGFLVYRQDKAEIKTAIKEKKTVAPNENTFAHNMIAADPNYWENYYWLGEYFRSRGEKEKAVDYYKKAMSKEVNDRHEIWDMEKLVKQLSGK